MGDTRCNGRYIRTAEGTTWPRPELEADDALGVQWKMRYAPDSLTREDLVFAASVMHAYGYLLLEQTNAQTVVTKREVRSALATPEEARRG